MEDRSKELRLMMKQSKLSSSSSSAAINSSSNSSTNQLDHLSGKERAQLLKLLKQKNKPSIVQENTPNMQLELEDRHEKPVKKVSIATLRAPAAVQALATNHNHNLQEETKINHSNLADDDIVKDDSIPKGFFDEVSTSEKNDNQVERDLSNQSSSSIIRQRDLSSAIAESSSNSKGNLPKGFFDDDQSDQINKKSDDVSKLESFLQEIESLPVNADDANNITEEEAAIVEVEEEAVQHAYETRLAAILHQLSKKKDDIGDEFEEIDEETFRSSLEEARAMIKQTMFEHQERIIEKSISDAVEIGIQQYQARTTLGKRSRDVTEGEGENDGDDSADDGSQGDDLNLDDYMSNIDWMARSI